MPFYSEWKDATFEQFVAGVCELDVQNTEAHIKIQSEFVPESIDFVGKLENFNEDFQYVLDRIGVKAKQPEEKKNTTDHKHWSTYYTPALKDMVYSKYNLDFERFGYEE